jgi:hypothetical protein
MQITTSCHNLSYMPIQDIWWQDEGDLSNCTIYDNTQNESPLWERQELADGGQDREYHEDVVNLLAYEWVQM